MKTSTLADAMYEALETYMASGGLSAYAYLTFLVVYFGACLGSFLNVCVYRIPAELSVVTPGSHCMTCKTPIKWYDNVPIIGYLVLRGKCRACGQHYSSRYMWVEIITMLLLLLVWLSWGDSPRPLKLAGFEDPLLIPVYGLYIFALLLATFIDLDHMIIPDRVSWGGIIVGLILSPLVPSMHGAVEYLPALKSSAIGAGVGFGTLFAIGMLGTFMFKKEAMGFGDVKLMGAIGAFIGWKGALFTIMFSSVVGAIFGISIVLLKRTTLQLKIPYGPYIAVAAMVWIFWGSIWVGMYQDWLFAGIEIYE